MRDPWCRRARLAALVAVAASAAACGEVVPVEEFERTTGVAAPMQPPPTRVPEVFRSGETPLGRTAPDVSPAAAPIGFGDGARVVEAALSGLGGERTLVQVVLYDGYGIVTSRSASGAVDRAVVRGDAAEAPTALPDATVRDPEAQRFVATDVDWSIVPGLVERTPRDLGIDGGTVSHVIVEKNVPFSPDLVIRVYVSTERRSGRIDYLTDGRVLRAFPG